MKTTKEVTREVMKRSGTVRKKRELFKLRIMAACPAALFVCLTVVIASLSGYAKAGMPGTSYGSFLLSAETGGYILVAVLALVLGSVFTLLALKYKNTKHNDE